MIVTRKELDHMMPNYQLWKDDIDELTVAKCIAINRGPTFVGKVPSDLRAALLVTGDVSVWFAPGPELIETTEKPVPPSLLYIPCCSGFKGPLPEFKHAPVVEKLRSFRDGFLLGGACVLVAWIIAEVVTSL